MVGVSFVLRLSLVAHVMYLNVLRIRKYDMKSQQVRCVSEAFGLIVGKTYSILKTSQSYTTRDNPTGKVYTLDKPRSCYYAYHFEVLGCPCNITGCLAHRLICCGAKGCMWHKKDSK
jgi:hypothetical protein